VRSLRLSGNYGERLTLAGVQNKPEGKRNSRLRSLDFVPSWAGQLQYGVTLYGMIDMGMTWQSHGTPFNGRSPPGDEYLLSKNSGRCRAPQLESLGPSPDLGEQPRTEFFAGSRRPHAAGNALLHIFSSDLQVD
jgi:hypothetical protein